MTVSSPLVFTVKRSNPELIAPSKTTPYEFKTLSALDDQKGYRQQAPVILFYQNSVEMVGKDPVKMIREAIAETLVHYYPMAGRLREGPDGSLVVECTGEGVLFIEADADERLDQFGDVLQPPFPGIGDLLYDVPGSAGITHCPLMLIQVTRLSCGGFTLAIRHNHVMCDAFGIVQFMNAVADNARGRGNLSVQPVWNRELLSARDPPRVSSVHRAYEQYYRSTNRTPVYDMSRLVLRSFFVSRNDVEAVRNHLPAHLRKCSNFDILTACLWRCRTIALNLHPEEEVRVACFSNARSKFNPSLPVGYYGNAIGLAVAVLTVNQLCQNPLGYTLELIARAKAELTDEFMRSTIDFLVTNARCGYTEEGTYYVADLTYIGFQDVDFGWGKAVYAGPTGTGPPGTFYIPIRNAKAEEGTVVTMNLPGPAMQRFAVEIEQMIREAKGDTNLVTKRLMNKL